MQKYQPAVSFSGEPYLWADGHSLTDQDQAFGRNETVYISAEVQLRISHVAQWLKNGCSVTHAVEELEAMIAESQS